MNPWKAIVVKHKAKSVKPIPDGWLTRAQVAEKIGCAEARVGENLRSAISAKDVLTDKFAIWDAIEGKVVSIQCFKINDRKTTEKTTQISDKTTRRWPPAEGTRVRRQGGAEGVMLSGGKIKWDSGSTTHPTGRSTKNIHPV